jgi:hypothetical protein
VLAGEVCVECFVQRAAWRRPVERTIVGGETVLLSIGVQCTDEQALDRAIEPLDLRTTESEKKKKKERKQRVATQVMSAWVAGQVHGTHMRARHARQLLAKASNRSECAAGTPSTKQDQSLNAHPTGALPDR